MRTCLLKHVVLLISCIASLGAQDPLKLLPENYSLVFENDEVRAIKVTYLPHQKLPVHDHARTPTVYVYLSDSPPVRFSHSEDHPFSLIRRPVKAGAFRISPGRIEKHAVENLGDFRTDFLRVELKKVPLGNDSIAFRGNKPFDLTRSAVTTEFDSPVVKVGRIVVPSVGPTRHDPGLSPSLVVAFTPATVLNRRLMPGDLLWVLRDFNVPPAPGPVHLLVITPK